jgi:hypothetical protein
VVVVPELELEGLLAAAPEAAVGLLVAGAGPETSRELALAQLVRGEVASSLLDPELTSEPLIAIEEAPAGGVDWLTTAPGTILLELPPPGVGPNDRRYPIAVVAPGFGGLLVSDSARIPGLVAIDDVAPTALGEPDGLSSTAAAAPLAVLGSLDRRIAANETTRPQGRLLVLVGIGLLLLAASRAGAVAFAAVLAAVCGLGLAGTSERWVVLLGLGLAVAAAPLLARLARGELALGLALAAPSGLLLGALLADPSGMALAPLGPLQNGRYYGLTNLVSTLMVVCALTSAWLLARRLGPVALVAVGALALAAIGPSSTGADGGGAIVLVAGLAALALGVARLPRRAVVVLAAAALALLGVVVGLESAFGASSHVSDALAGGPSEWTEDLGRRFEVSWARATDGAGTAAAVAGGLVTLAFMVRAVTRLQLAPEEKALPLALAAAIAVSLVVNDSPLDVVLAGLAGVAAALALAAERPLPGLLAHGRR